MNKKILFLGLIITVFCTVFLFFIFKKENKSNGLYLENKNNIEENTSGETLQYKNTSRLFTLEYPKNLSYKDIDEGDTTHTIVFSDSIEEKSFQVFFTPYYGNQITSSRILKDVPSGKYTTPVEIIIGKNIRALLFNSTLDIGEMTEVWFLRDGYLYQITAPKELEEWLAKIMETWEFYQILPARNF